MRVIAGRFRGRRLKSVTGRAVRPTSDRVREAIFGVLGDTVAGARILELYAGTGALALEAISRGAERAICVDRSSAAVRTIEANVRALEVEDLVEVVRHDALRYARRLAGGEEGFEVVFCDPPYADPLEPIVTHAVGGAWWSRAFVLEHAAGRPLPDPPANLSVDTRSYGDTAVSFCWR